MLNMSPVCYAIFQGIQCPHVLPGRVSSPVWGRHRLAVTSLVPVGSGEDASEGWWLSLAFWHRPLAVATSWDWRAARDLWDPPPGCQARHGLFRQEGRPVIDMGWLWCVRSRSISGPLQVSGRDENMQQRQDRTPVS